MSLSQKSATELPPLNVCESPIDAQLRQRGTATHRGKQWSMQAVIEKSGCELTILFLTPADTRALSIRQVGTELEVETFIDRELPFPAENVVLDIFRIFFAEWSPAPKADGTRVTKTRRERYRDTYERGALKSREVLSLEHSQPQLVITYEEGYGAGQQLKTVSVKNVRRGYDLRIETQFLSPPIASSLDPQSTPAESELSE